MSTAEEGGATGINAANPSSSSYGGGGGGGAGGKFRRKPFRRQATPYDRPLIANRSNSGWLKKLVVDPASKLISYGARRFFDSLLRKRIPPPPPPPQISEPNHVLNGGNPEAVPSECSLPISSDRNSLSDIERMLKQKTFTRTEIDRLSELLNSRAGEVSLGDDGKRNEETVSDFGRRQQIECGPVEENRNKGNRFHGVVSTPISNSKVTGEIIASPAELAKSYMGSRPSKLSPSALGNHSQVTTEGNKLISNMRSASKPVSTPFTMNTLVGFGSPENGYTTKPISFRRSAIYNMSRAPYSKRTGINNNGYTGLPMPSTSLSALENSEISESKSMTLKRRSFVLDDVGSVGPIRRIRQKSNLIASGVPHIDRVGSNSGAIQVSSKQKLQLIDDPMHVHRTEETTNISIPSTSYAIVPFESNDVEDNSSEPKVLASGKKSPFKLTSNMLQGKALRSMEDVTSSKLLLNVQDDHKCASSAGLLDTHDFPPQVHGEVDEDRPVETSAPPDTSFPRPIIDDDSAVSFKASLVRDGTSDDVENGPSQSKNRAAFRMSALEDYVDLDDDLPCNGLPSHPLAERTGPEATDFTDSKFSPPEEPKVLEATIKPKLESAPDVMSSKTSDVSSAVAVAASLRDHSSGIIPPASEEVTAALPTIPPPSVPALDKPKEINNPQSVFSFSSKVPDNFPSSRTPESSSSLPDDSSQPSSLVKVVEPKNGGYLKPLAAEDTNGKFDTLSTAATKGPSSSNINTHQVSTATSVIFTPSVSVSVNIPSGTGSISSATSSAIVFGAAETPKFSAGPAFSFGASPDPFTKASSVSTTITPAGDLKNNVLTDPSSGIPSSSPTNFVAFGASSSGNMTSGLSSSTGNESANNSQGSLFGSAIKSFTPPVGNDSQGTSAQSLTFTSQPSSDTKSSTLFSSLTSSQAPSPAVSFGFNSSTLNTASTSSLFGVNPSAVAEGSTGGSSSFTTPSMFSFGVGSTTSSPTNAIGSTAAATVPSFGFGLSSTSSSSTNAIGSTGAATVPSFGFGLSSTSSSSTNAIGSTGAATIPSFSFGASSTTSSSTNEIGSTGAATFPSFSFGASSSGSAPVATSPFSSSSFSASALGSTTSAAPSVFNFGSSSPASTSVSNAVNTFSNGASGVFGLAGSSSTPSPAINPFSSSNGASNLFGSLQAPQPSVFGSSPSTGFAFGASSTPSSQTNAAPAFPFNSAPASVFSAQSPSPPQPGFGNPPPGFGANSYQMNGEDSMAEDPMQSNSPPASAFGQPNISPPSTFMFGSSAPSQPNPFQFGGQQNQGLPQNPPMFQATGSADFNPGGSFSLGSGGGDKSTRRYVKPNRSKNRKK